MGPRKQTRSFASPTDGDDEEDVSFGSEDAPHEMEEDQGDDDLEYTVYTEGGDDEGEYEGEEEEYDESGDVEEEDTEEDNTSATDESGDDEDITRSPKIFEPHELISHTSHLLQAAYDSLEIDDDAGDNDDLDGDETNNSVGRLILSPAQREAQLQKTTHLFLNAISNFTAGSDDERLENAEYVSSLVLQLYFPPPLDPQQLNLNSNTHLLRHAPAARPRPLVLLNWLNKYHPSPESKHLTEVIEYRPNCGNHPEYWSIVQRLALRGRLRDCQQLLSAADWGATPASQAGIKKYSHGAVPAIQAAVENLVDIINQSPVMNLIYPEAAIRGGGLGHGKGRASSGQGKDDKWEVGSLPWRIWRSRITRAIEALRRDTEADPRDVIKPASRKADKSGLFRSKKTDEASGGVIPIEISKQMRIVLEILFGNKQVITGVADNWFDAVAGLVGFHDETGASGEGMDIDNQEAYDYDRYPGASHAEHPIKRISKMFHMVTDNEMPLPSMPSLETALGDILGGRLAECLDRIRTDSLLVASGTAELLGWGGYLGEDRAREEHVLANFGEDVLETLNSNMVAPGVREGIAAAYAKALCSVGILSGSDDLMEGWEVAVRVLSRVNTMYTKNVAAKLLKSVKLHSGSISRTEKLLNVCQTLGFYEEKKYISQKFAKKLLKTTPAKIGDALTYFSRAESAADIHEVMASYMRESLLASTSVPEDSELDPMFQRIISSPDELREDDLLRREVSGYAALRGFYAARAEGRIEQAAKTLVGLMRSAGEKVDCGVLDEEFQSVVDVECIGAFIVEMLTTKGLVSSLGSEDIFHILRVLEALLLVGGSTLEGTQDFFQTVAGSKGDDKRKYPLKDTEFVEAVGLLRMLLAQQLGDVWLNTASPNT